MDQSKTRKYTSINFDRTEDYPKVVALRNNLRKRLGISKLSIREAIMILINREIYAENAAETDE